MNWAEDIEQVVKDLASGDEGRLVVTRIDPATETLVLLANQECIPSDLGASLPPSNPGEHSVITRIVCVVSLTLHSVRFLRVVALTTTRHRSAPSPSHLTRADLFQCSYIPAQHLASLLSSRLSKIWALSWRIRSVRLGGFENELNQSLLYLVDATSQVLSVRPAELSATLRVSRQCVLSERLEYS
jgi:hypothetical protein